MKYDNEKVYQVDDLFLYLPKKTQGTVYGRIIDKESKECIVQMHKIRQESNYDVYQVSLDNTISVAEGECFIFFMLIQGTQITTSPAQKLNLAYDNFSAASTMFLMGKLSRELKTTYKKIEEFTKLNIQLYQDIKEVASK